MPLMFKEPHIIRASYRIVTPMFIGDANPEVAETIRPPSLKGAIRFWWRALNYGRTMSSTGQKAEEALCKLHAEESALFGSAADNGAGGQGAFLLSVKSHSVEGLSKGSKHPKFSDSKYEGARYLGYGLMGAFGKNGGVLDRGCINEDQLFTVKLVFKKEVDETVVEALKAFGLLGGLGSRTRKGMGSVTLESLELNGSEVWVKPETEQNYIKALKEVLPNVEASQELPVFSAVSNHTKLNLLMVKRSPFEVLHEYGKAIQLYRSWGYEEKILNKYPSEQNFKNDHDWSKNQSDSSLPDDFHPERIAFGLPQNYSPSLGVAAETESSNSVGERRASPLFFHVQALNDSSFIGVSLLLKSSFLPSGVGIQAGPDLVPANIDWKVLTDFIDGIDNKGSKRFPNRKDISGEVLS